ncbi:MAG TPA: signal peptidase II [Trueperaceae bacterium]
MYLLLAALLIAADQLSKWWATSSFAGGGALELGWGFRLTYIRNTGAAFGLLRDINLQVAGVNVDGTLLLGLLSAAVSLVIVWYLVRRGATLSPLPHVALALILAGALGNMIDRLLLGFVIDFIHFRSGSFDFPVFNLADSFVVIGGILLFLGSLLESRREAEERRALAEPEFFRGLDGRDRS